MNLPVPAVRDEAGLRRVNERFYGALWSTARLVPPQRFNTWPLVSALIESAPRRLEVAPGLRPRLPLEETRFVDLSPEALRVLRDSGASVAQGLIGAIPFPDQAFDLVCALDVVEHVEDDERALSELVRVAASGAVLLLSVPLHPEAWTAFDDLVGHRRRYEPALLLAKLEAHGLTLEQSAVYGMQPRPSRLLDLGMWYLVNRRERAMWWYNRVGMPLALYFQKPLALVPGMVATEGVDEVLLVCRKKA
ncbi:MAG: class SAM-dependent methyltransferase [Nevskia sp.]|nr:class SAM-dependent methyltransferase [Nevskia sp.]